MSKTLVMISVNLQKLSRVAYTQTLKFRYRRRLRGLSFYDAGEALDGLDSLRL